MGFSYILGGISLSHSWLSQKEAHKIEREYKWYPPDIERLDFLETKFGLSREDMIKLVLKKTKKYAEDYPDRLLEF